MVTDSQTGRSPDRQASVAGLRHPVYEPDGWHQLGRGESDFGILSWKVSNAVQYYVTSVLQYNVGLDRKLSLLLGGVIQVMFVIGMIRDGLHSRPPLMSLRILLSDLLFGPIRPSKPHDVGFVRPIHLHDDDRYSALVQG